MPKKNRAKQVAVKRKPVARKGKVLRNAPAQETIYTIRAIAPVPTDLDRIRVPLVAALAGAFPSVEDFTAIQTTLQQPTSEAPVVSTEKRAMGYRFKSAGGGHVAHFMLDGLVVNWVRAEYEGYEKSIGALTRYWQIYQEHFQPIAVDHVALRYINQLQLPLDAKRGLSFKDYIKNGPNLPAIKGLAFAGFQHYAALVKQPEGIRSRVMTATLSPVDGKLPLLLDYEAFMSLPDGARREPLALWAAFRHVHDWCETFFNKTLTERCRTLFS